MLEPASDLIGKNVDGYRVECLLGRGGMGEVWKAWDPRLERQVALKILSAAEARDEGAVRFEREAKAVSGVSHPNIAHVYATGRFQGRPYYVMEMIAGRSLGKILEEEGRIPGRRCLDYLRQAAEGLAAAHARGVVHRDVKPDNLMVDDEDRLKIVDFGLARRVQGDVSLTQENMVVGTPRYMAPEQATGGAADHRSDIYALGATFYHLLSGQVPFDAPTPVAVMMKHVNEPLTPLRELVAQVPVNVSAIVDRMMAKEPAQRYQTYGDLVADVKRALSGPAPRVVASTISLPTPPPRPSPAAASSKTPWPVLGAMAAAIGILVFLAFRAGSDFKQQITNPAPAGPAGAPPFSTNPKVPPGGGTNPFANPGTPPGVGAPANAPAIASAFQMAFEAKTFGAIRKLSNALLVYANAHEEAGLPDSLDELTRDFDIYGVHPKELNDGWDIPIRYEKPEPHKFRLTSAGPDQRFDSDDDIVNEDGQFVKGELDEKAMMERIKKIRGQ